MGILNQLEEIGAFGGGNRELGHLLANRPKYSSAATTFGPATPVVFPAPKVYPAKVTKGKSAPKRKAKGIVKEKRPKPPVRKPRHITKSAVRGNGNAASKASRRKARNR